MIELYAIKPFILGCFATAFIMRKWRKFNTPRTFEVKDYRLMRVK